MHDATVFVITADQRLARVLCAQAALCGMQSMTWQDVAAVPERAWQSASVAVLNLDEKQNATLPEHVRVLGLCRDPEALPLRSRRVASLVFRRPFSMADFRRELIFAADQGAREPALEQGEQDAPTEGLQLLPDCRCAMIGDRRISLSQKEFDLLSLLVQKGSEGVSKKELDECVGARDSNEGQVYICHLRKKLEHEPGIRRIQTVRGWGYRLI